jgi:hypothetical protein
MVSRKTLKQEEIQEEVVSTKKLHKKIKKEPEIEESIKTVSEEEKVEEIIEKSTPEEKRLLNHERVIEIYKLLVQNSKTVVELNKENAKLITELRSLENENDKLFLLLKKTSKRKNKSDKSGGEKKKFPPVLMHDSLCNLLNVPKGTITERGDVTSLVHRYATENGLKSKDDKSVIIPNKAWMKVFGEPVHTYYLNSDKEKANPIVGVSNYNLATYLKPLLSSEKRSEVEDKIVRLKEI